MAGHWRQREGIKTESEEKQELKELAQYEQQKNTRAQYREKRLEGKSNSAKGGLSKMLDLCQKTSNQVRGKGEGKKRRKTERKERKVPEGGRSTM